VAKRDLEHLLGRRHLEVQGEGDLGHEPVDSFFFSAAGGSASAALAGGTMSVNQGSSLRAVRMTKACAQG
jgi:hypothetical protein